MNPFVPTYLLELLLVFLASSVLAVSTNQMPLYTARLWQADDGLPQNSVQTIVQSTDGYLWIGTSKGLVRFDGMRFTVFDHENTSAIKNSSITALYAGKDNTVWIGSIDGRGIARVKDGKFSFHSFGKALKKSPVHAIYEDNDGTLWIGTDDGLVNYKNGRFQKIEMTVPGSVRNICGRPSGIVWFSSEKTVNCISNGQVSVRYTTTNALPHETVKTLFFDRAETFWIGTMYGMCGVKKDGSVVRLWPSEDLSDRVANVIFEDSRGTLWIGTFGGLSFLRDGKVYKELQEGGMAYTQVNTILEDREGNIWVGSKEGLHCLQPRKFNVYTTQQGLPHNNIMSLCEDHEGAMWFGGWGGGLCKIKDGQATVYGRESGFDLVLALQETRHHEMLAGLDFQGGLRRLTERGIERFPAKACLIDAAVRVIYEDRQDNIWLGTSTALILWKDGKFSRFTTAEGLVGNTVRAIIEDHEGNLWIGTNEGLSRWRDGKFTNFTTRNGLPKNIVISLYEDAAHNLWIGTGGGGLSRLPLVGNKNPDQSSSTLNLHSYDTKRGLFDDDIFEIVEDNFGNLWMSCLKGIFRVSKERLEAFDTGKIKAIPCVAYGKADGLASVQCNGVAKPAGWKSRDGRLWFATTKGATVVDPKIGTRENRIPPPILIEEIMADKKLVKARSSKAITLPPGRGELEFRYTALSFTAPERNRFKYKLIGHDSDWVDAGDHRTAFYNSVAPGDYVFQVMACNNDGVWNENGAIIKISLKPHLWQTWWFKSLVAVFCFSFVGMTVRYTTKRRMHRKLERLEQQHAVEKERARIAQDMHDDLGSRLSAVLLLTGRAQQHGRRPEEVQNSLQKISLTVRALVDSLDAIVWAVNPANDSLDRFALYIYEYLQMYLEAAALEFTLDVPDDLPSRPLASEVRHNLYLVVKECLNNVVKHSRATHVWFRLKIEGDVLCLSIEDNGQGIPESQTSAFGNGLQNMEKRMKTIGGQFKLVSKPGKGTQVHLKVPMTNGKK